MKLHHFMVASLLVLSGAAAAQSPVGFYVGAGGGANFLNSMTSSEQAVEVDTKTGPIGQLDIGWGSGNGWRAEIEGSYRSNDIASILTRRINGMLLPLNNVDGRVAMPAVMVNTTYDIPIRTMIETSIRPYIGAGVGYAWLQFDHAKGQEPVRISLPQNNTYVGPADINYGNAGAFAYQAIAGFSLPVVDVPGLDLTLEYRFFGTARADVRATAVATAPILINGAIAVPSGRATRGFEPQSNAILAGVRYWFP